MKNQEIEQIPSDVKTRMELMKEWIKKYNVKSILDMGSKGVKEENLKKIIDVDIYASITKLDLNKTSPLPFDNDSFDCVILSQILEHLFYPQKTLKEAVRITKKFVIVGLPHDFSLDSRLQMLLGRYKMCRSVLYGQTGLLHRKDYKKFIKPGENKLVELEKCYLFGLKGDRFLPKWLKRFLSKWNLFCRNFYIMYQKSG